MESTVNDRVMMIIDSLQMNPNSFAKALGIKTTIIYHIRDKVNKPSFDLLEKIIITFSINPSWLMLGVGSMYSNVEKGVENDVEIDQMYNLADAENQGFTNEEDLQFQTYTNLAPIPPLKPKKKGVYELPEATNERIVVVTQDVGDNVTVPIINRSAAANYLSGYQSQEYFEHLDAITFPKHMLKSGQHFLLYVQGDSMEKTFFQGDWVLCRLIHPFDYNTQITDHDVCVVVSKERGLNLKRVKMRLNKGFVRCRSDNRAHHPYNVEAEDLLEIWRVECQFRFSFPDLNKELYDEISEMKDHQYDLEQEVKQLKAYFGQFEERLKGIAPPLK
jgi:SOS-response transcriptional repressor LexA